MNTSFSSIRPPYSLSSALIAEAATTGMDRDAVSLGDDRAARVGDETGKVVGVAENGAARSPQHHGSHLLADVIEPVLDDSKRDWVELHGSRVGAGEVDDKVAGGVHL